MIFACCCPRDFQDLAVVEEDLELHLGQLKKFSFQDLQAATNNFSKENILGSGEFGPFGKVYKGILEDDSLVAVKRLKSKHTPGGELQFQKVMAVISTVVHPNVFKLIGICITPSERLLIYPYMANGSVASHLRDRPSSQPSLDWRIRKRIALESAKGLCFLHEKCNPKIIHCDVKAANIFLGEGLKAFVGDFALAKLMDRSDTHILTAVHGTIGHIAPEYVSNGKCSEKIDVYGYGIMLLELITGQKAVDLSRLSKDDSVMLLDWVKKFVKENKLEMIIDPDLQNNYIEAEMEQLVQVALLCTQDLPDFRPKMSEVVRMVESVGLAERWDEWQKMEISDQDSGAVPNPTSFRVFDSTHNLSAVDLSGPR